MTTRPCGSNFTTWSEPLSVTQMLSALSILTLCANDRVQVVTDLPQELSVGREFEQLRRRRRHRRAGGVAARESEDVAFGIHRHARHLAEIEVRRQLQWTRYGSRKEICGTVWRQQAVWRPRTLPTHRVMSSSSGFLVATHSVSFQCACQCRRKRKCYAVRAGGIGGLGVSAATGSAPAGQSIPTERLLVAVATWRRCAGCAMKPGLPRPAPGGDADGDPQCGDRRWPTLSAAPGSNRLLLARLWGHGGVGNSRPIRRRPPVRRCGRSAGWGGGFGGGCVSPPARWEAGRVSNMPVHTG